MDNRDVETTPGRPLPPRAPAEVAQTSLLRFVLNGEPVIVASPAHWSLLEVLRYQLRLTGTKQGCDKGDCGACTVLLDGRPINSCLLLALEVEGRAVQTVEGLGVGGTPHALQRSFDRAGAAQCGFCTPGMLMSAEALLEGKRARGDTTIDTAEIAEALSGNLCRCTGYTKILSAVANAWRATS